MREAEAKSTNPKDIPYYRNNTSENSLLFLAGWTKRRGTNGMSLKITSKDKGGWASFACQAGIDISQGNQSKKKKEKGLSNTDLNH